MTQSTTVRKTYACLDVSLKETAVCITQPSCRSQARATGSKTNAAPVSWPGHSPAWRQQWQSPPARQKARGKKKFKRHRSLS